MANANRMTALGVVNEVQRRLGLDATSDFSGKHARMLMQLLNEAIAEIHDYGNWPQYYEEALVTAATSVRQYSIRVSGRQIHNILEVTFNNDAGELDNNSVQDIRRLRRAMGGTTGVPRQYALIDTDTSGNPRIEVAPQPGSTQDGKVFNIAVYVREELLTTSDTTKELKFPGNLLVQGLYAKALLEENSGEQSQQFRTAYAEYQKMLREAQNRFTQDTEDEVRIVPGMY